MKGLGVVVFALGVACGSSRPPAPPPAPAPAPAAVAPAPVAKPAEPAKPVIPDTAAGHTMAAWLDAFNSGDGPRMKAFVDRYKDPEGDMIAPFREQTGERDGVSHYLYYLPPVSLSEIRTDARRLFVRPTP